MIMQKFGEAYDMLPDLMRSVSATVTLLAIGLQESELIHRRQLVGNPPKPLGPAKGLFQFERGGGCKGVITHPSSRYWMHHVCERRSCEFTSLALWNALETDDVLAIAAARLLLFTDPKKLPEVGDETLTWNLYKRVWRPGKPHPKTWSGNYLKAIDMIGDL